MGGVLSMSTVNGRDLVGVRVLFRVIPRGGWDVVRL